MPIPAGFPNADTAGVPAGATLTPYTGPMTISGAGVVIEGKIITGQLRVTGRDFVLKNSRLTFSGQWGVDAEGAANPTIEHCDLIGPGNSGNSNSAILGSGKFLANDISQCENGITLTGGASTVKGNYIHDLNEAGGDPHFDGISVQGGQDGVLIEDNTIIAKDTSCVFIKNDFGPIKNVVVNRNYMAGNVGYNVYVDGRASGGPITNVSITNNKLEKGFYGYYSVDNSSPTISGNEERPKGYAWPTDPEPEPEPEPEPMPDTITLVAVTIADPDMGTVSIEDGKVKYEPREGFSGTASGTYTIRDGDGQESTAEWSGAVESPPLSPPPVAVADHNAFTVPFGTQAVVIDVMANDFADDPNA